MKIGSAMKYGFGIFGDFTVQSFVAGIPMIGNCVSRSIFVSRLSPTLVLMSVKYTFVLMVLPEWLPFRT
jgi:hypothetical protein